MITDLPVFKTIKIYSFSLLNTQGTTEEVVPDFYTIDLTLLCI